jgi:hypothetical protein
MQKKNIKISKTLAKIELDNINGYANEKLF